MKRISGIAFVYLFAAAVIFSIAAPDITSTSSGKHGFAWAIVRSITLPLVSLLGQTGTIIAIVVIAIIVAELVRRWTRPSAPGPADDTGRTDTDPLAFGRRRTIVGDERQPQDATAPAAVADQQTAEAKAMAQQLVAGMMADLERMNELSDARANAGPPLPGIGEARYNPVLMVTGQVREPGWLSHYGGLPTVPPGFVWPMGGPQGDVPLHLLVQWDCRLLSDQDATSLLPRNGILYLFHHPENGFRFMHAPGPVDGWKEMPGPSAMPPIYAAESLPACSYRGRFKGKGHPLTLPHWDFVPVAMPFPPTDPAEIDPDDGESGDWFWHERAQVGEAVLAAQTSVLGPAPCELAERGRMSERPFAAYPHDWSAVRILAIEVHARLNSRGRWPGDEDPAILAAWQERKAELMDQTAELFELACRFGPGNAVPDDLREDIWAWFAGVEERALPYDDRPVLQAVNATLGLRGDAMADIPSEWIDRIRRYHALALPPSEPQGNIHAPCPNRLFGPPSYVQGYIEEHVLDHILLFEWSSTSALDLHLGEGVMQFIIKPDDLRAGRFDKVKLIASAY